MTDNYTEARHRAIQKYRSKTARLDITLTPEEKEIIQEKAAKKELSVKRYLISLVERDA